MDRLDRRLLDRAQGDFPIHERPFEVLGVDLDASPDDLLARLRSAVDSGLVRTLCAVFEPRRIGHVSGLAAMRVPAGRLESIAALVGEYVEVTHNYERHNDYSLWFALVAHGQDRLDAVLAEIGERAGLPVHSLPMVRRFKIKVNFSLAEEDDRPVEEAQSPEADVEPAPIIPRLVRRLCAPLPLSLSPYAEVAGDVGMEEAEVVDTVRRYRATGVIRRLGVMLRHHRAGFGANAMTVYRVAPEHIEQVGAFAAEPDAVSHCYERPQLPDFPYNLYAMVHGRAREDCLEVARRIAEHPHVEGSSALFSGREFKKSSPVYFPEIV